MQSSIVVLVLACTAFAVSTRLLLIPLATANTFFDPDETYQATLVAQTHACDAEKLNLLPWEWRNHVRSYAHILPFYTYFKYISECSGSIFDELAPRAMQSTLTATAGDVAVALYAYRHAKRVYERDEARARAVAQTAFVCHLTCWFIAYCGQRTYSSAAEASFTTLGVLLFDGMRARVAGLVCAALACAVRPTAALFWMPVGIAAMVHEAHDASSPYAAAKLAATAGAVALCALTLLACVDKAFYGRWTFPMLEFVRFNVVSGGARLYGTHPWHWYVSQAIPAQLFTYVPFAVVGAWRALRSSRSWEAAISHHAPLLGALAYVVAMSLQPHKELRFVLPVLPILCVYAAHALCRGSTGSRSRGALLVGTLAALQLVPLLFFGTYHQRGPIQASRYLAWHSKPVHALWLAPCHSAPQFFPTRGMHARFLDCTPSPWFTPTPGSNGTSPTHPTEWRQALHDGTSKMTEERRFFANSSRFARACLGDISYTHVATFERGEEEEGLLRALRDYDYELVGRWPNDAFGLLDDDRRGLWVSVWEKKKCL